MAAMRTILRFGESNGEPPDTGAMPWFALTLRRRALSEI
jgi:hypothetical protein